MVYSRVGETMPDKGEEGLTMLNAVPDYFQDEGEDALRSRVDWLQREIGLENRFFCRHLQIHEDLFQGWRFASGSLPDDGERNLRDLWRTLLHLLSFMNFDPTRVKGLLKHEVSSFPRPSLCPPWYGSSLISYLERGGPTVLSDVDRWMSTIRFGNPYSVPVDSRAAEVR
jgi:hypothetical protein